MLYELLRLPLMLLLTAFYKRIYFSNIQHFPKKGATIIASNHSTACSEQILLATFQFRGVHFWARATVFPGGLFWDWLFRQGHLIPIHRQQEGLKNMSKNKDTFALSQQLLLKGGVLYIAPEGNCVMEKRLRELKTGTARLALQTAAATGFREEVQVLPIGVNYTHHTRFRSEVMVSCGQPISTNRYQQLYAENPHLAVQRLTDDLRQALRQEMVYIAEKDDETLVEQLFTMFRNNRAETSVFPTFSRDRSRLALEQGIAETVNALPATEKQALAEQTQQYFDALERAGISDPLPVSVPSALPLVLFAPLAAWGQLAGYAPMQAARYWRARWVHDAQFLAPVALVTAGLSWFIYGLAWVLLAGWWAAWLLPSAVLGQFSAFYYGEYWTNWQQQRRYTAWKATAPEAANQLAEQRAAIVQTVVANSKGVLQPIGC